MNKKTQLLYILAAVAAVLLTVLLTVSNSLYALDSFVTDRVYTKLTGANPDIIIIGVDEESLAEYGTFATWSREKTAQLLDLLYSDPANEPAVVGLDIMFIDEYDEEADAHLAKAAADTDGSVVVATNIVYRGAVKYDGSGSRYYDTANISDIELPFDDLSRSVKTGFSNAHISSDGYVRCSSNAVSVPADVAALHPEALTDTHDSLAYSIYKTYMERTGQTAVSPKTEGGLFRFYFSCKSGEYSHLSLKEVLAGNIPPQAFKDAIVLVGAYAPGMQDAYLPAIDRGHSMYGVEVHANIIQAYLQGKTALDLSKPLIAILTVLITLGFILAARKLKLSGTLILSGFIAAVWLFAGRLLASGGTYIPAAYILLFLILADAYYIVERYVIEKIRRRRTLDVFKKYVAPQVVDSLAKTGDFEIHLGGEKKNIAALFVDIRGFTPLSESLEPEMVVGILNQYLKLTTDSIFKNGGTLDKFVGDATMAVFNAPFDLDDYVYRAVHTAWDICQGAQELNDHIEKEYGKSIGFGIGVNCGEAVVGNIGCDFRMDYTAIGDTVNTAARLESNAKSRQILVSEEVMKALGDRIRTTQIGEIPLKGKSKAIMVYQVDDIKEDSTADTAETEHEG